MTSMKLNPDGIIRDQCVCVMQSIESGGQAALYVHFKLVIFRGL